MAVNIQEAIEKARQNAAGVAAQVEGMVPATTTTTGTAVAQPGPRATLDDFMNTTGLVVDTWIKTKETGLFVGNDKKDHEKLRLILNMKDVAYVRMANKGREYRRSYDNGVTDSRGGSWHQSLAKLGVNDYLAVELPFLTPVDIIGKDGKTVLAKTGQTLGYTTPPTGWKNFVSFIKVLEDLGIDKYNAIVEVNIISEYRKNADGEWGVMKFEPIQTLDELPWKSTKH